MNICHQKTTKKIYAPMWLKAACMRIANFNYQHSYSKLFLAKRVLLLLMAFLFSFSFILPTLPINSLIFSPLNRVNTINAYAESNEQNSGIVATDSITDTENLLGDSVSKVADMIETTKKRTGVNVRLLYLSTFEIQKIHQNGLVIC